MDADPLQLLRDTRTIAMVGASPNPLKPSHGVMRYLLHAGYRVIPVRDDGCESVHGVPCVASLDEIEEPIDMVDVFRRPKYCPAHAREAVEVGAKSLWLQQGIRSPESRRIAAEAGMPYVEDACTAALHAHHLR
jgi:predicted CoA-binding protein